MSVDRLREPEAPAVPELVKHREDAGRSPVDIARDSWLRCGPKAHAWKVLGGAK